MPAKARLFSQRMRQTNLLCAYQKRETIERTLASIGRRLKKRNPLNDLSTELWQYCEPLESSFHHYYQQLLNYSQQQKLTLTTPI